jgi:hypothetical protein
MKAAGCRHSCHRCQPPANHTALTVGESARGAVLQMPVVPIKSPRNRLMAVRLSPVLRTCFDGGVISGQTNVRAC